MNDFINGVFVEDENGFVYADSGYLDAEQVEIKTELVYQLQQLIDDLGLPHSQAAELIGKPESWLSNLLDGKIRDISQTTIRESLVRLSSLHL
jgi:predicted XRE-type DNA-binding protein